MKILKNYFFLLILLLIVSVVGYAQPENHYCIKAAQVNYIYSGDFTGSEILAFDNYGLKEVLIKKLHTAKGGKIVESKTVTINDTVVEMDLSTHKKQVTYFQHNPETNSTKKLLKAGNFKKTGEETIAGCTCQKYTGEMGIVCIWKGIILKSEISVADKKMIKTAVSVDTLSALKPLLFSIDEY
ncbi:MAG: hypothetical protein DRJ09_03655 [Bacteroidetes bacterium]|nr:MAG: hypothetical protein DRJ09_03655 [Bacteroidota bacterium]